MVVGPISNLTKTLELPEYGETEPLDSGWKQAEDPSGLGAPSKEGLEFRSALSDTEIYSLPKTPWGATSSGAKIYESRKTRTIQVGQVRRRLTAAMHYMLMLPLYRLLIGGTPEGMVPRAPWDQKRFATTDGY